MWARLYRLWGRGRGVPRQPNGEWKMPSSLGGKLHGTLGQPAFFLAGNRMATVAFEKRFSSTKVKFRTSVTKISNIYKWKDKVQKNTRSSFWWKAKSSSYEICFGLHLCCLLQTQSAQCLSSQHLAVVLMQNIAELVPSGFFLSTTKDRTHFPRKNTSMFMSIGIFSREKK